MSNQPTLNEEPLIKLSDVKTKEDLKKFLIDYSEDTEDCCFCEECMDSSISPDTAYVLARILYVMNINGI